MISHFQCFVLIDELNNENVPPINVRIDFPKHQLSSLPVITLCIQERSLTIASHALDIILRNLEEIFTPEEKLLRKDRPRKLAPINIHLNNVHLRLNV